MITTMVIDGRWLEHTRRDAAGSVFYSPIFHLLIMLMYTTDILMIQL